MLTTVSADSSSRHLILDEGNAHFKESAMRVLMSSLFFAMMLAGCQSTGHDRAELVRICADPASRLPTPGNLYYDECQALYPSSPAQLRKYYQQNAPVY